MISTHGNGRKRRMISNVNCQDCLEEDTIDDMVQCDVCDKWAHFSCAGVGPEIANLFWQCRHCKRDTSSGLDPSVHLIQPSSDILHQNAFYTEAKRSKNVDNDEDMLKQNPVTVSEKLKNFEKKFEAVTADVAELKIELQLSKDQCSDAKQEIAKLERENAALHSQLLVNSQEIQKNRTEIHDLKKKIELEEANVASAVKNVGQVDVGNAVKTTDVMPRIIFQKLPCKTQSELIVLKEDLLRDLGTLTYMEERFGSIGGSDPKSCITSILNRLLSKELQSIMSLTGKRTDRPVVLMDYIIIMDLINNAVRKTHENHKDKDSEPIITKILSNK